MAHSPPPHSVIKAITFDVGNVLVRWDPRHAYAPLFGKQKDELDFFLQNICSLAWHSRHDQGVSFADNIIERQRQFPAYSDMIGCFEAQWDNMFNGLIDDTIQITKRLHDLKYPLYTLTNFPAGKYDDFRRQHECMKLFTDHIVSGEEKVIKPDLRIYKILIERTRVAPSEILFIDDRQENLQAAAQIGIQTHLFRAPKELNEDLVSRGIFPDQPIL